MCTETRTVYVADDGQEFTTEDAPRRHDFNPEGLAAALVRTPSDAAALAALLSKVE